MIFLVVESLFVFFWLYFLINFSLSHIELLILIVIVYRWSVREHVGKFQNYSVFWLILKLIGMELERI